MCCPSTERNKGKDDKIGKYEELTKTLIRKLFDLKFSYNRKVSLGSSPSFSSRYSILVLLFSICGRGAWRNCYKVEGRTPITSTTSKGFA